MILDQQVLHAPVLDHDSVDLEGAERVSYLLEQSFRYDYPAPVHRLRHRLLVLPPVRHGNQYRRAYRLEVAGAQVRREMRRDARGNTVVRIQADRVERTVSFGVVARLERVMGEGPVRLPASALTEPRLLRDTGLTAPDVRLADLARELGRAEAAPLDLADLICRRVHSELTYEYGTTGVRTTAAEALAGGRGVCQDFAHVMLSVCHLLALPARYVSGHLLGQGGTHAWVEVVVPDSDHALAVGFDPCNGVAASAHYLTVATGRDYSDVAPTSGSYVGGPPGQLTTARRISVLAAA